MAPPSEKNPRKRAWDHEKDLYDFLLDKIKISDPNTQKKMLNDLLHKCYINDPKADSDLINFTDGPSTIIQSHLLHLQDQNSDSNNNEEKENLIEYEDEHHRFLMNHIKPHGKSYVLEIVEDDVYIKYGDESSRAKKKGKLGVKKSNGGKSRNVQTNCVVSKKGGRANNAGKRKRGCPSKILEKNDVNEEENVSAVKSAFIDESVKKEIQDDGDDFLDRIPSFQKKDDGDDDGDGDDDVIHIITVESSVKYAILNLSILYFF